MSKKKTETAIATTQDTSGILLKADADYIKAKLAAGAEMVATVMSLEEDQMFEGVVVGKGAELDYKDPHTGEPKVLETWRFRHASGMKVDIPASHQLNKDLPALEGHNVVIQRLKQKDLGAKRVNQFAILDCGAV